MALALFTAVAISHRYTGDFCPPLVLAAAFGAVAFDLLPASLRRLAWTLIGLLTVASVLVTLALALHYQGEGVWGVPDEFKARYQLLRQAFDSALGLNDSKVCVQEGTTTLLNVADYFRTNNMKYTEMKFPKLDDVVKAYNEGKCDTLTADVSQLYALRLNLSKPNDHTILPDVISKEPLAPVVRQRDDDWMMIVKWTLYAMINAEELGITSKNIDEALKSKKPDVMRLVGTEGAYGEDLGLTKDWAARIIRHVGNYGEIYDRNVGAESKLKIPRGLNSLWSNGGIQYAPPIR